MSIKILIDMNLSIQWVDALKKHNISAIHWSTVGNPKAKDREIMAWAREHRCVVLTHDLDFGTLLALTQTSSPSVIQIRTQNILPEYFGKFLISAVKKYEPELLKGCILVLDEITDRLRLLPFDQS